ncbi:MAG: O-acetylhomoserine aminocarboxypropyltransferase/cysteine synthase family protein [Lachnospiraceae bacterium]
MAKQEYEFETLRLRAGYDPKEHNYASSVPIYQTTAYELDTTKRAADIFGCRDPGFLYTRVNNPTTRVLESRIAALDGGTAAIAVGSGMAAITYALLNVAEGGKRVLTSPFLYGGSFDAFQKIYPRFGIHFDFSKDITNLELVESEITEDTRAIFVESVSNPNNVIADLEGLADVAHRHNIPLIVDNTFATPYLVQPLKHGADVVIYSATKSLSGHGNVIAGLIVEKGDFPWDNGKFKQFEEPYYTLRDEAGTPRSYLTAFPQTAFVSRVTLDYLNYLGAPLGPNDAFLTLLGIETLAERLDKAIANATKVAEYLESNPHVSWVRYGGLQSHPQQELIAKYYPKGVGSIFSFGVKGSAAQADAVVDAVELFSFLANVGDSKSLIVNSPRTTHGELTASEQVTADLPENLLRLSIGLESADDLIADLEQALDKVFG